MTRFQIIFTVVFAVFAVAGAIAFALSKSGGSTDAPPVTLWGTLPTSAVSVFLGDMMLANRATVNVVYQELNPATFESQLIAALARGQGPDFVMLPHDLILRQLDKFYIIPFENYSERIFKDSFIEGSEIYLTSTGIVGLPFSVDPMVMYWNRDLFSNAGLTAPPVSWTELYSLAPKLIKKDASNNILQSLVAFGTTANVLHSKEIISLLALQAGTSIVGRSDNGSLASVFAQSRGGFVPGEQVINFFTEFSNPVKTSYSWNGSLTLDRNAFISGKLALYFGPASEVASIRAANPNLNFDVAVVPQTTVKKTTFGSMTAIALLKSSPNLAAAYTAAVTLTGSAAQAGWVAKSGNPPIRRDLLTTMPGDAYKAVFYQSALMSRAWLDPNKEGTANVFARLIQNVTSGRYRTSEAVKVASQEIDVLLR